MFKIRNHARNWWYYRDLRKQGKNAEARRLEHESIRENIRRLRQIMSHGGYLHLGRAQWGLDVNAGGGQYGCHVSGYYDIDRQCYFESICDRLGIAILDSRDISFEDACTSISLPIPKDLPKSEPDNTCLSYASLNEYCKQAEKFPGFKARNIKKEGAI